MSCVLHINGWPGTGKRTIGRLLAARLGGRMLDNHALLNPAEALFDRGDPRHAALREAVREITLDHAAGLDDTVPLVLTDALAEDPGDAATFARYRILADRRAMPLMSVVLDIGLDANLIRLTAPGREDHRKLTRPEVLLDLRSRYRLLRPAADRVLALDVSDLDAETAAAAIEACWRDRPTP